MPRPVNRPLLLPHQGRMRLIEQLVDVGDSYAVGRVVIKEDSEFYQTGLGVPAYVGLEYMAQTIAAFDGARRAEEGRMPAIGLLLGTRQFTADRDYFVEGDELKVRVAAVFEGGGMGSFECSIDISDERAASATLSVFRPDTPDMPDSGGSRSEEEGK